MKTQKTLDTASTAVMVAGTAQAVVAAFMLAQDTSNDAKRTGLIAAGGLMAAAGAYRLARLVMPPTREEQRVRQALELYHQADEYRHKANDYRLAAEDFFKRRLSNLRTAISS